MISGTATNNASGLRYNTLGTATDTHRFQYNGVTQLNIKNSGNVGIGTTSPGAKLDVAGGTDNLVAAFSSTDDVAQIQIVDHDTSTFLGSKDGLSYISQTAGTPSGRLGGRLLRQRWYRRGYDFF